MPEATFCSAHRRSRFKASPRIEGFLVVSH
jgi:hypothetical protein